MQTTADCQNGETVTISEVSSSFVTPSNYTYTYSTATPTVTLALLFSQKIVVTKASDGTPIDYPNQAVITAGSGNVSCLSAAYLTVIGYSATGPLEIIIVTSLIPMTAEPMIF